MNISEKIQKLLRKKFSYNIQSKLSNNEFGIKFKDGEGTIYTVDFITVFPLNENYARLFWEVLGDIPVNENEELEEPFLYFELGDHREEVWSWFEETFNIRVYDLMYSK